MSARQILKMALILHEAQEKQNVEMYSLSGKGIMSGGVYYQKIDKSDVDKVAQKYLWKKIEKNKKQ